MSTPGGHFDGLPGGLDPFAVPGLPVTDLKITPRGLMHHHRVASRLEAGKCQGGSFPRPLYSHLLTYGLNGRRRNASTGVGPYC